jgi:hypothetical protein
VIGNIGKPFYSDGISPRFKAIRECLYLDQDVNGEHLSYDIYMKMVGLLIEKLRYLQSYQIESVIYEQLHMYNHKWMHILTDIAK